MKDMERRVEDERKDERKGLKGFDTRQALSQYMHDIGVTLSKGQALKSDTGGRRAVPRPPELPCKVYWTLERVRRLYQRREAEGPKGSTYLVTIAHSLVEDFVLDAVR